MGENTEQTTNRKTETTAQMNELTKLCLIKKNYRNLAWGIRCSAWTDRTCADTDPLSLHSLQENITALIFCRDWWPGISRTMKFPIGHRDFTLIRRKTNSFPYRRKTLLWNFRRNIEKSTVLPFKNLYRSPYGNAACSHTSALPKRDVWRYETYCGDDRWYAQYRGAYPCPPLIQFCNEHACRYSKSFFRKRILRWKSEGSFIQNKIFSRITNSGSADWSIVFLFHCARTFCLKYSVLLYRKRLTPNLWQQSTVSF